VWNGLPSDVTSAPGLVTVGVQEQAEDILVPLLLRNCLTFMTFPFLVIVSPPQNSGLYNSFYCLGHSKMSMMVTMMKTCLSISYVIQVQ